MPKDVLYALENTFVKTIFLFVLKLVLVLAAVIFAVSLLLALVVLVVLWSLRAAWARLTGQSVAPFVMRVDPRSGFNRVFRARSGNAEPQEPAAPPTGRVHLQDVTDVEAKPPRNEP